MVPKCVRMTVEWLLPLGQMMPITHALHSLATDIRAVRGCIGCSVSTDIGPRAAVRYMEEWKTEEDLRHRLQSDTFMKLVTLIEVAPQPPRIEFALPAGTRGLDFVEEVRRLPE